MGQIAGIITGAGRDVTRELGEWATEVFEMREAARRARADREAAAVDETAAVHGTAPFDAVPR